MSHEPYFLLRARKRLLSVLSVCTGEHVLGFYSGIIQLRSIYFHELVTAIMSACADDIFNGGFSWGFTINIKMLYVAYQRETIYSRYAWLMGRNGRAGGSLGLVVD
jgi:hypothetical protein